jgi:hypothetical protein
MLDDLRGNNGIEGPFALHELQGIILYASRVERYCRVGRSGDVHAPLVVFAANDLIASARRHRTECTDAGAKVQDSAGIQRAEDPDDLGRNVAA